MSGIEAWDGGLGAKAIAHRKSPRVKGALAAFLCARIGKGHWHVEQLARKMTVDDSSSKRVVLASTKRVFVTWVHQTPELRVAVDRKPSLLTTSDPFPADPMVGEREALAVSARDAAGVSES